MKQDNFSLLEMKFKKEKVLKILYSKLNNWAKNKFNRFDLDVSETYNDDGEYYDIYISLDLRKDPATPIPLSKTDWSLNVYTDEISDELLKVTESIVKNITSKYFRTYTIGNNGRPGVKIVDIFSPENIQENSMNQELNKKIEAVINKANGYKEQVLKEESEEEKAKKAIDSLIDTKWSEGDDAYKNLQLLLGLASSKADIAKKFIKKIDDFTSSLNKDDF